ncbi:MAG: BON domain-containing protein [Kangiellaceae bacterium]|nr:BON domain-containing protein [Kangiellaceae bacterium]
MKLIALALLTSCCFLLSGCAGLFVAGAATGAVASQDRRTVPAQLEDENIEIKSSSSLFEDDEIWKDANIDVISYNGVVLLVGQAPTASLKLRAKKEVEKTARIRKIYNQIRIAAPIAFFAKRQDEFLTSKVKSAMLFAEEFPSSRIKVVTENTEVFLLGLVTVSEADKAVEIARNIDGVSRVVKVFETIEEELD